MSPMPADLPPVAPTFSFAQPTALSAAQHWQSYTIRPGDTLYDLAAKHKTTVSVLVRHNKLDHGGRWIMTGQVIQVPGKAPAATSPATKGTASKTSPPAGSAPRTVTVRPGDTLSHIALRHNTTVGALVRANGLDNPRLIHAGQQLQLPGQASASRSSGSTAPRSTPATPSTSSTPAKAATPASTVTVQAGDTLSHIAARHGVALSEVLRANSDLDPRRLWVGQQVKIPATAGGKATAWTPKNIGEAKKEEKVQDTFLHYTYPQEVARSAAANREYLAGTPVPSQSEIRTMVVATAKRHGVDPALMLALSRMESGWNQRAVSPANAIGVMQVIPSSGQWASSLVGHELNLLDPQDNITAGTVIMRALLRAAKNEDQAIAGYYQGLAGVQKNGMYPDTKSYVKTIQASRKQF